MIVIKMDVTMEQNGCVIKYKEVTMSNDKQSSLDYYITKLTEILGPKIIKQISRDDNERIARLEKQAKAMHKSEIIWAHGIKMKGVNNHKCVSGEQYYNETYGGNK